MQAHLDDVDRWRVENLITSREEDRLVNVYEPLRSSGPEWIGESRRIQLPEVLLHLGGWLVLAAILLAVLYGATLVRAGLLLWVHADWYAHIALFHLPFALLATGIGFAVDRRGGARHAQPFYLLGMGVFVASLTAIALFGPGDWLGRQGESKQIAARTWLIANGLAYYTAAWLFERKGTPLLRWYSRPLYLATPVSVLLPLHLMERQGISFMVGSEVVYLTEVLLPLACLAFILLAIPLQLKTFFYSGLLYLAIAIQRWTALHFEQARAWPVALLVLGTSTMGLGIAAEWVRARAFPDRAGSGGPSAG